MQISEKIVSGISGIRSSRRFTIGLLFFSVALYWSSLYFYLPTLPVYIKSKVESLAVVGIVLSMYGLWQALIRFPLGILSDWAGRRKPFIISGFLLSGLGAWVMASAQNGIGLGVGRAITGLAAGTWVPLTVFFSALFPPEEAIRATAMLTMVNSVGRLTATGLTGWLNEISGGYLLAFFIAMVVALVAALAILPIPEARRAGFTPSISSIFSLVKRPDVLRPSLLGALAQYVTWSVTFSFIPILASRLGATDWVQSGLTSGSIAIVMLGNMVTTAVARVGYRRLTAASFAFLAAGTILAAFSPSLGWLFLAQFISSLGAGISHPLLMGLSISKVDDQQRSTAMGLHQAIYGFGMFAGPSISGALADGIGIQPMFAATGFLCLILGFVGVRWLSSSGL